MKYPNMVKKMFQPRELIGRFDFHTSSASLAASKGVGIVHKLHCLMKGGGLVNSVSLNGRQEVL